MVIPKINNAHGSDTRNIINEIIKAINDRGLEILSESAFLNWLGENGVKHQGEWVNSKEYDRLSVVLHEGNSYTSVKHVPVGVDILNEEYWIATGNYNAQVEYYREETERVAKDLIERGINVTLPPYNAKGDNTTDDTSAITQAINDLPNNGVLILPYNKVFRVSGIIVNKPLHILGGGTVKFIDTKPLQNSVISCTSKVTVQDITVDGNVDNISEYEGTGIGLLNSGNGSKFINVKVNNTKFNAFSNREGSHVNYLECYSNNAGYGGFHNYKGDYLNISNCFAENFKIKGFVHNGSSKMINLNSFKAITDSLEQAVDPVLIDGNGVQVEFLSLDNIYINGANRSNALKIIDVDVTTINDLKAMSNNTLYGIHVYGNIGRVDIKNSYIVGRVSLTEGHKFTVENTVIDASKHIGEVTTIISPLSYKGEYVNISNVDIIGGTGNAINIDASILIKNKIDTVYYEGSNNLIGIAYSGNLDRTIKQIELNGYTFKNNNDVASVASLIHIRLITNIYSGLSDDRPPNADTGQEYFDRGLGHPIYWDGSKWVNAIGEEVI